MIGFFKNLLSGILSFFVGLLRGKKAQEDKPSIKAAADKAKELPGKVTGKTRRRSGYFMELDESEETKPVEANQSANGAVAKTPVAATAAKPAKEQPAKTPVAATAAKPTKEEPAKTDAAAASAQSAKVELVQTAEGVKPVPAEKTPAASKNGQTPTETTFAPKYLAPTGSSNSRRRPGPSMNPFLDMARQVKTPG